MLKKNFKVGKNTFLIFYKPGCPYCIEAENIIKNKGFKISKAVLGKDFTQSQFRETFDVSEYGYRATYPKIWFEDDFIGGCDDLIYILEDDNNLNNNKLNDDNNDYNDLNNNKLNDDKLNNND